MIKKLYQIVFFSLIWIYASAAQVSDITVNLTNSDGAFTGKYMCVLLVDISLGQNPQAFEDPSVACSAANYASSTGSLCSDGRTDYSSASCGEPEPYLSTINPSDGGSFTFRKESVNTILEQMNILGQVSTNDYGLLNCMRLHWSTFVYDDPQNCLDAAPPPAPGIPYEGETYVNIALHPDAPFESTCSSTNGEGPPTNPPVCELEDQYGALTTDLSAL